MQWLYCGHHGLKYKVLQWETADRSMIMAHYYNFKLLFTATRLKRGSCLDYVSEMRNCLTVIYILIGGMEMSCLWILHTYLYDTSSEVHKRN